MLFQVQLSEEKEKREAAEGEAREAQEAVRKQQAGDRREAERLQERLCDAEQAAEPSQKKASDLTVQLQASIPLLLLSVL